MVDYTGSVKIYLAGDFYHTNTNHERGNWRYSIVDNLHEEVPQEIYTTIGDKIIFKFDFDIIHLIPSTDRFAAETQLHNQFEHRRVNGEWFALADFEIDTICKISGFDEFSFYDTDQKIIHDLHRVPT